MTLAFWTGIIHWQPTDGIQLADIILFGPHIFGKIGTLHIKICLSSFFLKKKIRWAGNPQRQSFALQKLAVSGLCLSSWDGFAVPLLDCLGSSLYQSIAVTWLLAVQKQRGIGLSTFSWVHISLCLVDHFCSWGLWIFFLFLQDVHFLLYFVIWSHLFSICQSFLFVYLKEEECCKNTSIST
jgi:hypothetical protein